MLTHGPHCITAHLRLFGTNKLEDVLNMPYASSDETQSVSFITFKFYLS